MLGPPAVYSPDRFFVYIRTESGFDPAQDAAIDALEQVGYAAVRLAIGDAYDLGQEFLLWQLATAIAAAYLGANPFAPSPCVREVVDNTERLLQEYDHTHLVALPKAILQTETRNLAIVAEGEQALRIRGAISLQQALESILRQAMPGDSVALLAYVQRTDETVALLQRLRLRIRDTRRVATMLAFESLCPFATGHAHAGTAGLCIQFVATDATELPIPGADYGFGVLAQAQALGELRALERQGRRVLRIDLGANVVAGLSELQQALDAAQLQA
jgi:transaldolase/glucose-6-phosphate isomerase